jgi:septal ring factor EnvC (AmiA/AmiB activator)
VTLSDVKEWAGIAGLLAPIVLGAMLWWLSQRFATKSAIERVEAELDDTAKRLAAVEQRLNALPTASEFAQLRETLARVEAMTEANEDLLRTIHRHLLTSDR